jgi:hypothetical protein
MGRCELLWGEGIDGGKSSLPFVSIVAGSISAAEDVGEGVQESAHDGPDVTSHVLSNGIGNTDKCGTSGITCQ